MKIFYLLALATVVYARNIDPSLSGVTTAYGYIGNYAIPLAERIREAEEKLMQERIAGGSPTPLGQIPYQAGLIARYLGTTSVGVCGGSLVNANRVITAAHCWFDGTNQAWELTIVLGSINIFFGGLRLSSSNVAVHSNFVPTVALNDVAVIYLPTPVSFSSIISPIALPSGDELTNDYTGVTATTSGFGLTGDDASITPAQFLSHVNLTVISNSICAQSFPNNVQPSNICTSGLGGTNTCWGDSGGPLVVTSNNRPIIIGITSFGAQNACQQGFPAAYSRVSSFIDFFNQNL